MSPGWSVKIIQLCVIALIGFAVVAPRGQQDQQGQRGGQGQQGDESSVKDIKLHLEDFRLCPGKENLPLRYHNISIEPVGRGLVAVSAMYTADIVTGENNNFKVSLDLTRCDSKQQVDSCQHFLSDTIDFCKHLPQTGQLWSLLVNYTKGFVPYCPLQVGTFVVEKAAIPVDALEKQPVCIGYWKVDVLGIDDDKPVFCNHLELSLTAKRKKRNEE